MHILPHRPHHQRAPRPPQRTKFHTCVELRSSLAHFSATYCTAETMSTHKRPDKPGTPAAPARTATLPQDLDKLVARVKDDLLEDETFLAKLTAASPRPKRGRPPSIGNARASFEEYPGILMEAKKGMHELMEKRTVCVLALSASFHCTFLPHILTAMPSISRRQPCCCQLPNPHAEVASWIPHCWFQIA